MHLAKLALLSALVVLACSERAEQADDADEQPSPSCPLTGIGGPCTCPGSSVCPANELVWYRCLDSGVWDITDLSCALGLHCRTSADCSSGEVCCGDASTRSSGTQIISSSCQPTSCSSYSVQLCSSSADCAQPGLTCGAQDPAYGGGSVSHCQADSN
jgi:hypothetical protein